MFAVDLEALVQGWPLSFRAVDITSFRFSSSRCYVSVWVLLWLVQV